jgi:hypothetical protein
MAVGPTQWIAGTLYPDIKQLIYEAKLVFSVEVKLFEFTNLTRSCDDASHHYKGFAVILQRSASMYRD